MRCLVMFITAVCLLFYLIKLIINIIIIIIIIIIMIMINNFEKLVSHTTKFPYVKKTNF